MYWKDSRALPDTESIDVTDKIEYFFTGRSRYNAAEQRQPVAFRAGVAHVPRLNPEKPESLEFDLEEVVDEVEGIRLPATETVARTQGRGRDITRRGTLRRVGEQMPRSPGRGYQIARCCTKPPVFRPGALVLS
jgi:hypothetical protein